MLSEKNRNSFIGLKSGVHFRGINILKHLHISVCNIKCDLSKRNYLHFVLLCVTELLVVKVIFIILF
jgi:hypothetical protein